MQSKPMTKKMYKGTLAVYENQKPEFTDVLWRWMVVIMIGTWFNLLNLSHFGSIFIWYLRILAIVVTFKWLLVPKHSYQFKLDDNMNIQKEILPTAQKEMNLDSKIGSNQPNLEILSEKAEEVEPHQYCISCGNMLREDAEFCGMCGVKLV